MLKNILAVLVGMLAGGVVVMLLEMLGHLLFPLPFEVNYSNIESMKNTLELNADRIPMSAYFSVIIAHLLGTLFGVFMACKIAKNTFVPAYVVIGLMLLFSAMNFLNAPTPVWAMTADLVGVLFGGYIGLRLGSRDRPQPINPHLESR